MSERPKFSAELHLLCGKLREGELSEPEAQRLNEMLLQSKKARRYYSTFMALASALETRIAMQESVDQTGDSEKTVEDLFDLLEQEQEAEVVPFDEVPQKAAVQTEHLSKSSMSLHKFGNATSYLLVHALRSNQAKWLAAAAVLLLGMTLAIVLLNRVPDQGDGFVEVPVEMTPTEPLPSVKRVVATVTDQVNAQWVTANGQGAFPDRMLLAVNQRLTLVKGFAEITTNRGAKVLLQAPATIETTDSDNAIRLHRGKLVGRCETPGSKGFTVHVPGMDVVDIGTQFGVEADETNGSTVLVISGSVRAEPADTSPLAFEPVVLFQGDVRRVDQQSGGLQKIAAIKAPVFYADVPPSYVAQVLEKQPIAYWFPARADPDLSGRARPPPPTLLVGQTTDGLARPRLHLGDGR
ncbi:MAG: FecR domain-containing protein, partial [Planctomycetota bacterium]